MRALKTGKEDRGELVSGYSQIATKEVRAMQ